VPRANLRRRQGNPDVSGALLVALFPRVPDRWHDVRTWEWSYTVRRSSGWIWGGRAIALLTMAALAGYLFIAGLGKADEIAGVLGLLVAVLALVAPYLLPPGESSSVPSADQSAGESSVQLVAKSVVRGRLTQLRVARAPGADKSAAVTPEASAAAGSSAPTRSAGQHVTETSVGGDLTQIDGADGDVIIG